MILEFIIVAYIEYPLYSFFVYSKAILSDLRAVGAATIPLTGQEIIENTEVSLAPIFLVLMIILSQCGI